MKYNGIIIFGEMGSGKDTLADLMIEEDNRIKKYGLGDIIRTIKPVSYVDPTWFGNERSLYQTFADKLREIDMDILNHFALGKMVHDNLSDDYKLTEKNYKEDLNRIFQRIITEKNTIPMIVGGRTFSDYDYWKKRGFLVVGLVVDAENRMNRLTKRDGETVAKNSDSTHNTEKDVRAIIDKSDYKADNNSTLENLRNEAEKIIELFK